MPRYIDADALIKKIFPYDVVDQKCYTINAKAIYEEIKNAPTCDVVPRSEVEKIFDEYGNYNFSTDPKENFNNTIGTSDWLIKGYSKEEIAEMKDRAISEANEELVRKAKQEVVRKMSAEMEHEIAEALKSNYIALSEFEEADELYYRVKGKIDALRGIQDFLAELKKKHIGE